jgi:SulP family sulfate permease
LILWPRINKKIPAPIVVLGFVTVVTALLSRFFPSLHFATIGNQFVTNVNGHEVYGIPALPPMFTWPWSQPGPGGSPLPMTPEIFQRLASAAFAIAMLAAIESLLSAVVADGMGKTKHDPDSELVALGIGNVVCAFFGAIPATGAIARTATNINFGSRSPFSAIIHGFVVLLIVLVFAPWVGYLPMASLAALLLRVAYNMADIRNFRHILKVAPQSDVTVLLLCFLLTVFFDMVIGVSVGFVMAAVLFMRRMAFFVHGAPRLQGGPSSSPQAPENVLVYEISGPMFFGAAQRAVESLQYSQSQVTAVVIDLGQVPVMDVTGLVALETAVQSIRAQGRKSVVTGVRDQPLELIRKSSILSGGNVPLYKDVNEALSALSAP